MKSDPNAAGPAIQLRAIGRRGRLPLGASKTVHELLYYTRSYYDRVGYRPPWIGYLVRHGRDWVGTCGFKGAPRDGRCEIAYTTFEPFERQGFASAMARELVRIAREHPERPIVTAQTLPIAPASQQILRNLGFEVARRFQHPDDGLVFEWVLDAPTSLDGARLDERPRLGGTQ